MAKKTEIREWPLHGKISTVFLVLFSVLASFHVFLSIFQFYDADAYRALMTGELWAGLASVCLGVLYLTYLLFFQRNTIKGVWRRFRASFGLSGTLLLVLFIWYILDCLIVGNKQNGNWLKSNDFPLFDTFISVILLFNLPKYLKNHGKTVRVILFGLAAVMSVLLLLVLVNVFRLNIFSIPNGQVGMDEDISLCIACNRNITGMYVSLFCYLCLYAAVYVRPLLLKILFSLSALVNFVALVLTKSRASYVSLVVLVMLGLFMLIRHKTAKKKPSVRWLLSIGCALAAGVVLLVFAQQWVFGFFEACTHMFELLGMNPGEAVRSLSGMSGREIIWPSTIKALLKYPDFGWFGVTPVSLTSFISLATDGAFKVANTHNQFLDMWAALGVPGFLLYFSWMVITFKNCLKTAFSPESDSNPRPWAVPLIILALVITNLMEARLLFSHYLPGPVFFFLCGLVSLRAKDLGCKRS